MRIYVGLVGVLLVIGCLMMATASYSATSFKHVDVQYIAALGDPSANSGADAESWGLWPQDPGPRGCMLDGYDKLKANGGITPAQWKFDDKDWWLEEHGLMMEKPQFPIPPGQYVVTGGREVTTILTIYPKDKNGAERWELANGATLYDVTHLPCRAARYTSLKNDNSCSPSKVQKSEFPVTPGAKMPPIDGCHKQDYAVLLVIGVGIEN